MPASSRPATHGLAPRLRLGEDAPPPLARLLEIEPEPEAAARVLCLADHRFGLRILSYTAEQWARLRGAKPDGFALLNGCYVGLAFDA